MAVWHIQVHLTSALQEEALRQVQAAVPRLTAIGHEASTMQHSLHIDVDADNLSDAKTAVRSLVESVLGSHMIDRVGTKDEGMQNRQVMLWIRAARRQVRRWEVALAVTLEAQLAGRSPDPYQIWDAQIERHFALVALNNLLRAIDNSDGRFAPLPSAITRDIRNQRDLLEHWDEQWPSFYDSRKPGPLKRGGIRFAATHPGENPFSFLGWNSREGPRIGPGLLVGDLHAHLNDLQADVLAVAPDLGRFVSAIDPSPWLHDATADFAWWPKPPSP